ncbi:hypothetical protein VIGAN_11176800 [Vigna angularis var. angularis]|uniref:Reverse transcriptase Ty1/copia-type domain-containing protein n=1 Tax=Vigna angularis var. angularis TaxID=157739 RepID=A0A0S3TAN3_PHAAN|nr:hypothetical protein VIGAN_11176800 [Vigna angularis var. angularis]
MNMTLISKSKMDFLNGTIPVPATTDLVYPSWERANNLISRGCLHQSHFQAAFRVVRYLKSCPGKGLFFSRTSSFQFSGFSDADWPMCVDTRHSITGYCFIIGSSLVSWLTKEQSTVSRSFAETEY